MSALHPEDDIRYAGLDRRRDAAFASAGARDEKAQVRLEPTGFQVVKLFMKFYNKKYTDDYKGIQYTSYSSYYDDETCEDYDKDVKIDEIDKVEEFF